MIILLCGGGIGFPNGTAPTARVTAYARGLVAAGSEVMVLCVGTSEYPALSVLNTRSRGSAEGIWFEYTCGTTLRGETFLKRRWLAIKGPLVAGKRVLSARRRGSVEALLLYPETPLSALWFWLIARLTGAVYLLEKSELPFHWVTKPTVAQRIYIWLYTHSVFKLFDGTIVISRYLEHYMAAHMRQGTPLLRIPILVDTDVFGPQENEVLPDPPTIGYCGTLNEAKDGVLTLMRAFAAISGEFPDATLLLIGDSYKNSQIPTFRAHAEKLGIADRVIFTGVVGRDVLPAHLRRASVLALARPSSGQAEAGFPTKLGEYLATGRPVLVTRTGEITNYLTDGISAYLSAPDDVSAFADRLRYVLTAKDEAACVGQEGSRVCIRWFDYRRNAACIRDFITELHARRRLIAQ